MPGDRRLRLLSVGGAMVLTVLAVTALTTLLLRTPGPSAGAPGRGPGGGVQAGDPDASAPPTAQAWPTASASPTAPAAGPVPSPTAPPPTSALPPSSAEAGKTGTNTVPALSVSYRTVESFPGGYIGEITIRPGPGGLTGWTATVDLPAGALVTSAWDRIDFRQDGGRVTLTPQQAHRRLPAGRDFTFAFQVGDQSGATRPDGCAVNSTSCS
ncbi:cellulose binding domain-containing protein [Catellatospora bangladeshensis]